MLSPIRPHCLAVDKGFGAGLPIEPHRLPHRSFAYSVDRRLASYLAEYEAILGMHMTIVGGARSRPRHAR